jgi:hypothetical protein
MCQEKSTYLITALQGQANDMLNGVLKGATYKQTFEALEDRIGDQHFAAAYHSQLKIRTQKVGESLQEFAMAVEQLTHGAYPVLPEDHIRRQVGKMLADGTEDPAIKLQLLLGGVTMVNEAVRQDLELQAMLLAARPHKTGDRTFCGRQLPPTWRREKMIGMLELLPG